MIKTFSEPLKARIGGWASDILASPFIESAIFKYQNFSDRERFSLRMLFSFSIILFVIYGLLLPAINYSSDSRQAMLDSMNDYQWIEAHSHEAKQLSENVNLQANQGDLLTIASSVANEVGLVFQRYEPNEEGKVRFHLEAVVFDALLNWIELLGKQRGIVVVQIIIDNHSENGKVNAMVQLRG